MSSEDIWWQSQANLKQDGMQQYATKNLVQISTTDFYILVYIKTNISPLLSIAR